MKGLLHLKATTATIVRVIACLTLLATVTAHAQFNTSRAVQRAIETNTRSALERIQISLKVSDSAGKIVVQKVSRSGRYLLLVFEDDRPRVWDLDTSRYWDHFEAARGPVVAAAIRGDMRFVTLQSDGSIARWTPESRQPLSISHTDLQGAAAAELDRTGALIVVDGEGDIYSFSDSLRRLGAAFAKLSSTGTVMAMDPSGDVLATSVDRSELRLWSSRNGTPIAEVKLDSDVTAFTFGDVSSQLFIATAGGIVEWDVRSSAPVGKFACSSTCRIEKLLVNSATQSLIAVTGSDELLRWSIDERKAAENLVSHPDDFAALTTAAGAPLIIGGTTRGLVQFSHLERPEKPLTLVSTTRGWAMIDPLGRFDGQAGQDSGVSWGDGRIDLPLPSFADSHFEPGLFSKWLRSGASYLTDPKALSEGVLVPPRIEMSLSAPEPGDPRQLIEVRVKVTDNGGGLGTPSLYHLGLRVSPEKLVSRSSTVENNVKVSSTTWQVRALPGENTFTARVKDMDGIVSPARVESIQVDGAAGEPALHLLAIAIDDYGDRQLNLNYSIADADAIVEQFEELAAPLFSAVHTTTIKNRSATREGVLTAIRALREANPEDVIVIYAATHGEVIDESFHLLLQGLRFPLSRRLLKRSSIAFDEFAHELELLDARRVVMLLDTCKSGDALEDLESEFRDRRALQSFSNLLGIHLIAATAKGQLATETSVLGHGVFTYSILDGLKGGADRMPVDGLLTASELADFAEAGVPALSARYAAFPQWPTVYARGFDFSVAAPANAGQGGP